MNKFIIHSAGIKGPGFSNWDQAVSVFRGETPWNDETPKLTAPDILPANEKRRSPDSVRLAMTVAQEALERSGLQAGDLYSVFASSDGDGKVIHQICEAFWDPNASVSPTRFSNSVHNAPAGYWNIGIQSMKPSTSIAAFDHTFAAGLLEATLVADSEHMPVLLVAYDLPYMPPLLKINPVSRLFGTSLIIEKEPDGGVPTTPLARFSIEDFASSKEATWINGFDTLTESKNKITQAMPFLQAISMGGQHTVYLEQSSGKTLELHVQP